MEELLKRYIENFLDMEKRDAVDTFLHLSKEDIENEYKRLLPYANIDNYTIKFGESASYFIEELFKRNVDDNTFVISAIEHSTIEECLVDIKNKFVLHYDLTKKLDIDSIVSEYIKSGCNKIFLYGTGILETQVVSQVFYEKLKDRLVENNIEHIFVLDDVQSCFLIPRDYSIFDYVIYTCHAIIPYIDSGILFCKNDVDLGYEDIEKAHEYLIELKSVLKKKDYIFLFKRMMIEYFSEELSNEIFSTINSVDHIFYLKYDKEIGKFIVKHRDEFKKYKIDVEDTFIMLRFTFLLDNGIDDIIECLNKIKKVLNKCIKLSEMMGK